MPTERPSNRRQPPRKPPPLRLGVIAANFALTTVLGALVPRLQRLLDWPARAGRRRRAAGLALHAAVIFAMDGLMRLVEKGTREREELKARLRDELGRPPWPEEIDRAWREAHGFPPDGDPLR
jgi:hypothetical protein